MVDYIKQGDCLELMKNIPDKSIDMILCDLPYGTTACKWDNIIPFEPLWEQYNRVIKDNGAIVLTATNPFSSVLVSSNLKGFKHEWIWQKEKGVGFQVAKYRPMQEHEHVLVFTKKGERVNYYPIKEKRDKPIKSKGASTKSGSCPIAYLNNINKTYVDRYPTSIKRFQRDNNKIHPTQKPVALFEYLIKTYTKEGETVLDNCMGSGTTAIAALNTGRFFIGIEKEKKYVDIANKRIEEHQEKALA
jgi:site-specific DNA-methyltransferase (adenine-specific)